MQIIKATIKQTPAFTHLLSRLQLKAGQKVKAAYSFPEDNMVIITTRKGQKHYLPQTIINPETLKINSHVESNN